MARILIDGRFVGVGDSISRYVLELTNGIVKLDHENQYTLLVRPVGEKNIERYPDIINAPNLHIDVLDIPHYSLIEQTRLLSYLNKEKFDLVHFTQFNHPVFYRGNFVTTIHDLTLIGHLHYHNFLKQLAYNTVMRDAVKRSSKIISISKFTEKDVIEYFGTPKDKFSIIYHGIDHARFNGQVKSQKACPELAEGSKVKSFKEKYQIDGEYIFYAGMWKKHKNLMRLFKAYEQFITGSATGHKLPTTNLKLVLAGKVDENEPEIIAEIKRINQSLNSKFNIPDSILTIGHIYDELPVAYAGAKLYVIPSLSEGFGWPPLEAMACGTPVIASKESCIPEILGDAPLYFDPYNVDDIANAITKVASDEKLQAELTKKGLDQVKKYNWDETAKKTLKVYKEALNHTNKN